MNQLIIGNSYNVTINSIYFHEVFKQINFAYKGYLTVDNSTDRIAFQITVKEMVAPCNEGDRLKIVAGSPASNHQNIVIVQDLGSQIIVPSPQTPGMEKQRFVPFVPMDSSVTNNDELLRTNCIGSAVAFYQYRPTSDDTDMAVLIKNVKKLTEDFFNYVKTGQFDDLPF